MEKNKIKDEKQKILKKKKSEKYFEDSSIEKYNSNNETKFKQEKEKCPKAIR